jgi:hypothetical protein
MLALQRIVDVELLATHKPTRYRFCFLPMPLGDGDGEGTCADYTTARCRERDAQRENL